MRATEPAIVAPVDADDHVRGGPLGPVVIVYSDYQCMYSRVALHEIERVGVARGMRSVSSSDIFR